VRIFLQGRVESVRRTIALVVALAIITYVPVLTLWLPGAILGP